MKIYLLLEKATGAFHKAYSSEDGAKAAKKTEEAKLSKKADDDVKLRVKKVDVVEDEEESEVWD